MSTSSTSDHAMDPGEIVPELTGMRDRLHQALKNDDPDAALLVGDLEAAYEELRVADEEVRAQRQEIERLIEQHTMLRWQQERMLAIIPVAVLVTDPQGVIRSVNAAAAGLLEMRVSRLLGKPLAAIFATRQRAELRSRFGRSVASPTRIGRIDLLHPRPELEAVDVTVLPALGDATRATWLLLPAGVTSELVAGGLPQALASLAALPGIVDGVEELLRHAAPLVQAGLGGGVVVSLTLGSPEVPLALASTGEIAAAMDGAQLRSGEGPCVTAFADTVPVLSDDVRSDPRWPQLAPLVPPEIHGAVAVALEVGERVAGALNVYRLTPEPAGDLVEAVELAAATIAAGMYEMEVRGHLQRTARDMESALTSRAVIDQAKGIVMAHRGCSAEEAFEHLVHLSSTQEKKLRVVAQELVNQAMDSAGGS
jgi:PAS domain-containing protein